MSGLDHVPDPVGFTADALSRRGALAERDGEVAVALLPANVACELSLPEECRLSPSGGDAGAIHCGLGSPLLERLVGDARARTSIARVRLDAEAPRASQARACAERFVVRNGVVEILDVTGIETTYVAVSVSYAAEADDRHEGVVPIVVHAAGGGEPDAPVRALANARSFELVPVNRPIVASELRGALPWIASRTQVAVRAAIGSFVDGVARRQARDYARIVEYFAALVAETSSPKRRVDPATVAKKVAHLVAERDAKLRDLDARFTTRVTMSTAACLVIDSPAMAIRMRVRRRKEERIVVTHLPAGAHAVDGVACAACDMPTTRPAVCDERLHMLCEACAPAAQGRLVCGGCRRPPAQLRQ